MTHKRAYILIEIMVASVIFITASFSLAKSFTQSAHTYKILHKINDKYSLRKKIINQIEIAIKDYQLAGQDLVDFKNGSISEEISYSCNVERSENLEGLYLFELKVFKNKDFLDQFEIMRFIQNG